MNKKPLALVIEEWWILFIAVIPVALLIILLGGFNLSGVFGELGSFLTGKPEAITTGSGMTTALTLGLLITLGISLVDDIVAVKIVWAKKSEKMEELMSYPFFKLSAVMFPIILLEEVFARWFFLGFLRSFFQSDVALYALFLLGGSLWALLHFANYGKGIGRVFKILTFTAMSVLLGFVYLKFGFWAVVWVHCQNNYLSIAIPKLQERIGRQLVKN